MCPFFFLFPFLTQLIVYLSTPTCGILLALLKPEFRWHWDSWLSDSPRKLISDHLPGARIQLLTFKPLHGGQGIWVIQSDFYAYGN